MADLQSKIYRSAVHMLSRREHGRRELQQKLQRKFNATDDVACVLDQLVEQGLQSDARFAESLVRGRINRGYGPSYVQQEARAKGLDGSLTEQVIDELEPDWQGSAAEQVARRFPEVQEHLAVWEKACRFLQRRGFDSATIRQSVGARPRS